MKTVMIASTGSGRGKTTVTSALLYTLKKRGANVHAYKCGPDYIDPMYHRQVLGIPSANLDSFFCDEKLLKTVFYENAGDINIIESAMGLYDGIGASKEGSAYDIASILDLGIVLVIDARGMGFSIVAELNGFISLDKKHLIRGVILNRTSKKFYEKIAPVIEKETGINVFGFIPVIKDLDLKSRHLGLLSPDENDFGRKIKSISETIQASVCIDEILDNDGFEMESYNCDDKCDTNVKCRIAVAKDEAFSFIYEENIKALINAGAEIVWFSPIHDEAVPENVDGLIFYGGYPENYLNELSSNSSMINSIKLKSEAGIPILAECGGYMYLLDGIEENGHYSEMVGIIKGTAYREKGLVRFGYVNVHISENEVIKGHEFHHYDVNDSEPFSEDIIIESASTGQKYSGFVSRDNIFAGFPHLYYLSNNSFLDEFIKKVCEKHGK